MTNVLGPYNPTFYANEGLDLLYKSLGMSRRVYMGFDEERKARALGEPVTIRKPGTFTAQDAPSSSGQDIKAETVTIPLDYWKDVVFKLTDRELAMSNERIIEDHIAPAAYALGEFVDAKLAALAKQVPWSVDLGSTPGNSVAHIVDVRKQLVTNNVPMNPDQLFYLCDPTLEAGFLTNSAFTQWQGAGPMGEEAQRTGAMGRRFGLNLFMSQNAQSHTKGTSTATALAVNGATSKGATTINLDAVSVSGTLVAGDSFVIAGNSQRYAVTGTFTASGNAFTSVTFTPPLAADAADDASVTVLLDDHVMNMAFHRNAFALVMPPLPAALINQRFAGANVGVATDEQSGLSLRSSFWYEAKEKACYVSLDILFGVKCLDPNLACRGRG